MSSEPPKSWIDKVLARADELRSKGVSSISEAGNSATFLPLPEPPPTFDSKSGSDADDDIGDPLHDPRSYPHGIVPGFTIEPLPQE